MKPTIFLAAALALAATGTQAQTSGAASPATRATPPTDPSALQQANNQTQRLAGELGLSASQQQQVRQLLLATSQEMKAAREQAQASGQSQGLRPAMQAARTRADARLRAVLTPAQFAHYQQLMAERIGQLHGTSQVGR